MYKDSLLQISNMILECKTFLNIIVACLSLNMINPAYAIFQQPHSKKTCLWGKVTKSNAKEMSC